MTREHATRLEAARLRDTTAAEGKEQVKRMLKGPRATLEDPAATGEEARRAGELVERLVEAFFSLSWRTKKCGFACVRERNGSD